jgi:alpha-galactosidase
MNPSSSTVQPRIPGPPVITLIGAGSRVFTFNMGTDICQTPALRGSVIRLVDVNAERLDAMRRLFECLNARAGMELKISACTDRRTALPGSDFVILSVAVDRIERWRTDLAVARKHGIVETQGECGGPGGLSLTLRNIPLVLDIARDIAALAPKAVLLNFTNPMTRVCRAVERYTPVRCVGLCHGVYFLQEHLTRLLGRAVEVTGFGINHFNWIHAARWADSGADAWTEVRRAFLADSSPEYAYTRDLFAVFDRIVEPDDGHITDFLHHWRIPGGLNPRYPLEPKNMDPYVAGETAWNARLARWLDGAENPLAGLKGLSGEGAIPIVCAMRGLAPPYDEVAVNIPNRGCIPNLPDEALVELPGRIGLDSVRGHAVGELPAALRSLIARQLDIAELAIEAAVEGDRRKALQALAIDPIVTDLNQARHYLDDVLRAHRDLLPAFSGTASKEQAP